MTAAGSKADAPDAGARALSPGVLDELLGFHLRLAQAALYRDFVRSLAKLDLSQRQFAVLELVRANPGVSQAQLAGFLALDRPAIMSVVDRLEQRGLVLRERSRTDRRRQEIRLTAEGDHALDVSYSITPYGGVRAVWRVMFVLDNWTDAPPRVRQDALAEIKIIKTDPDSKWALQQQTPTLRDLHGRATAILFGVLPIPGLNIK